MIIHRDTTVGYHCPNCGMPVLNRINVFLMEGKLIKLKCFCKKSELVVQMLKDDKFKLTTPCILCPDSHVYTLSSGAFFQKDLFSLSCKFTAIDICFIGKWGKVREAMRENEEILLEAFGSPDEFEDDLFDDKLLDDDWLYDENAIDDHINYFNELLKGLEAELGPDPNPGFVVHKTEPPPEHDIADLKHLKVSSYNAIAQLLKEISNLHSKKRIDCRCGEFDGKVLIQDDSVYIECKNCGSSRTLRAANTSDLQYLDDAEKLYLDY